MEERAPVVGGLSGFRQQQEPDDRECQNALASKVCGASTMTRVEIGGENEGAHLREEGKPTWAGGGRCFWQPRGESML